MQSRDSVFNVPALRFPEFSGEWSKDYLSEFLEVQPARNTQGIYSKNDVLSVSGDYGVVNQIELLGRSFAGKDVSNYHIVRINDIVYTKSPLKEFPYGIVKTNQGADGIVSTLYAVYSAKSNTVPKFVEYYFSSKERTNKYFKPIVRIGAKHDMKIGNEEVLRNIVIFPSRQEQHKIQEFLRIIDERISTQSKIIEEQETLLKSLADKLISSQVANVALCDCVEAKASTMKESELESYGIFPVYGASGLCGNTSVSLEHSDSILITKDGSGVGTCQYATGKHSFLGTLCSLTAKENVYLPYIYYALLNFNFASYKTGLAIPHIYFKDYGKATIYCPSYEEQVRIASGLERLDAKINADIEILKQYRLQKEYLLSRMFI